MMATGSAAGVNDGSSGGTGLYDILARVITACMMG